MKRDGEWFWMPWNDVRVNATNLLAPTGPGRRGGIKVSYRVGHFCVFFNREAGGRGAALPCGATGEVPLGAHPAGAGRERSGGRRPGEGRLGRSSPSRPRK